MVNESLREGLYNLSKANSASMVLESWIKMGESTIDKVAIISLDSYDRSAYPSALNNLIKSNNSHFVSYFETDKLYFIDNELLAEIIRNQEKDTQFSVDYSIMLDTNYASYIDNFIRNDWSSLSNEVFVIIDLLIRHDFHYDYIFYMIENYKNSFVSIESEDENLIKDRKTKLYLNLVSLQLFKSIDREVYLNSGKLEYNISMNEAQVLADQIYNGIFYSSHATDMMEYFISIQRYMVLLIIGIMQIKFDSKTTVPKKMQKLFDFSTNIIGIYFEREMVIAHKYFTSQRNVKILNKINKGIKPSKLLQIIENIAWDFSVPRIMERQLVAGGAGRYFIPFFLSNDYNLRQLLSLFKIKGTLYSKSKGFFVPFTKVINQEYFETHNCNVKSYFTDEVISHRAATYKYSSENQSQVIKNEFSKLVKILSD